MPAKTVDPAVDPAVKTAAKTASGTTPAVATEPHDASDAELLRIQEVADTVGLTARSIRYYEEVGLLEPAARSEGAYRLYDLDDVERLRFIKGLRDDAGFSLSEIGQLLEDETARAANRTRFRESRTAAERRDVLTDGIERIDRQVATLQAKIERLRSMVDAATQRRTHLERHLADLAQLPEGAPPPPTHRS